MANNKTGKKTNFIVQGGFGSIVMFVICILELIRRVMVTNLIGDEGNGMFSAAYEIYMLFILFFSYGIPLTVPKMLTARISRGQVKNAGRIARIAFFYGFVGSTVAFLILFFGAETLMSGLLKDPLSQLALKCLAPSVILASLIASFEAFFMGMGMKKPVWISRIISQIFQLITALFFCTYLYSYGKKIGAVLNNSTLNSAYGSAGYAASFGLGMVFSFGFLVFLYLAFRSEYRSRKTQDTTKNQESYREIGLLMAANLLPVLLYSLSTGVGTLVSQILFNSHMAHSPDSALMNVYWGVFYGKYRVLVMFPLAVISIYGTSVIPQISVLIKKDESHLVKQRILQVIRTTIIFIIPFSVLYFVLAQPLTEGLFHGELKLAASMLKYGALYLLFASLTIVSGAVMQAAGKFRVVLLNSMIALGINIIFVAAMLGLTDAGIYAVVYAGIVSALCNMMLNVIYTIRKMKLRPEYINTILKPVGAGVFMALLMYLLENFLLKALGPLLSVLIVFIAGVILYYFCIIILRTLKETEVRELPFGDLLIRIGKIVNAI